MAVAPEIQREISRKWRLANPDRTRSAYRKWRAENKDRLNALARARYAQDPAKDIEKQRRWRTANPQKVRDAQRKSRLKLVYGMTVEQLDDLFVAQGCRCALCNNTETTGRRGRGWHTDHCHNTKKVRGILCQNCNLLLGHARDNVDILRAAIIYLERRRQKCPES